MLIYRPEEKLWLQGSKQYRKWDIKEGRFVPAENVPEEVIKSYEAHMQHMREAILYEQQTGNQII